MKKILFSMMAVAGLFASCQSNLEPVVVDEVVNVSLEVGTPEVATRAYSDGMRATKLQYAVYDVNGNKLDVFTETDGEIHGKTTVDLQLTTGNTYKVLFWASAPEAPYTVDLDAKTMTVDYSEVLSNDENLDAFYKWETIEVTGPMSKTVELKRPFAQLNVGTNDFEEAAATGYEPTQSYVKVTSIFNTLDLSNGKVSGADAVEFALNTIPSGEKFPVENYDYLAMNYLLVDADKEVVDVEFGYQADGEAEPRVRTVGSVPVQRNHRTNLYGQLLTSNVEINVEILPDYDEDDDYGVEGELVYERVYTSDEFAAAVANEDVDMIKLGADIELSTPSTRAAITPALTVSAGKSLVIDLSGYTLSYASDIQGQSMIQNNGDLIIKGGDVVFNYTGEPDSSYGKGNYTISNAGTLTVDANISIDVNGYENKKFPHALYVIQNAGKFTVNGGLISNDHNVAVRNWVGSETSSSDITLNDGEIRGTRGIWNQLPSGNANLAPLANITVKGGTLTGTAVDGTQDSGSVLAIYSYNYGNKLDNVQINIEGGVINGDIVLTGGSNKTQVEKVTITGGEFNGNEGDVFSYAADNIAADAITIKGGKFSSLATMKYLNSVGEVVTLANDLTIESASDEHTYMTFKGVGTLDLNKKTITVTSSATGSNYNFIDVNGKGADLTVKNGTINYTHVGTNMGWGNSTNVFNVTAGGVLNIVDAEVNNLGGSDMGFVAHLNNWGEVTLNVENSVLTSNYVAVRVFNSGNDMNNVTIKNTTLKGANYAFWVHNYTVADFGTQEKADAQKALLNFDIFGNGNTFIAAKSAVRLGFTNEIFVDENGVEFIPVSTPEQLSKALAAGQNVALTSDVEITKIDLTSVADDVVIDANGHKITTASNYGIEISAGKNVTVKNAEIVITVDGNYITYAAGIKINNGDYAGQTIAFENCELRMKNTDWAYAVNMPANVKNLNLVIDNCVFEGAIALQCWGDNNKITINGGEMICNYTTSALYTSYCVVLQGDGSYAAENNVLSISDTKFSYSGVDNFNSEIYSVSDESDNNTNQIIVSNCTYEGVEAY